MISPRSFCYQLSTDVLTALHESVGLYEYDGSPASRISTVPGISVREVSSPDTSELFTTTTSLIWREVQEVKIRVSFTPGAHECTGKAAWLGLYIPVSKSQGGYKLELTNSFPSEPVGNYVQSASNPDTKWGTVSIPVHPPCQRVHTIPVPTTVTTPSSVAIPSAHESIPCCFSDAALMRCDGLVPIIPLSWKSSSQETSESACSQACIEKVAAETMGTHWWWVKRSRDVLEQQGGEVPLAAQYIPITHADGSLFGITLIVWIVDGESTTDTSCTTCPTTDASSELTRAGHARTQPHLMDRTMVQRVVTRVWDFVVGRALARPGWRSNCSPRETKRNNKWPQYFLVVSGRSYLMLEGDSNGMLSTENSTPPLLWELECKHVPCIANSEALEQLEGSLGIRHLPEISYVQNFLCLWFRSPPGTFFFEIGFDLKSALSEARDGYALGSIRRIEEAEGIRFEVEPSARWRNESQARRFKGSTSSCAAAGTRSDASLKILLPVAASELRVFEAHIDWAFRSEYFGKVTFGNATASVSCTSLRALCDALRREGESPRNVDETTMLGREEGTWCSQMTWANDDGSLRSIQVRCASGIHEAERLETEAIDFATLRRTDVPIQFFECVDLFEDELHDCGTSHMTVRVRVMPTCWFVLLQHIVRVDGVALRLTETRWFADKKTPNKVAVSQVSWLLLLKNLTSTTEVHKRGNTQMRKEQNINVNDPSWRAQLTKTSAYTVVFEF